MHRGGKSSTSYGAPLGSVLAYPYRQQEIELHDGDTVLLLSDGLVERFNPDDEQFDYASIETILAGSTRETAQNIINRLITVSEEWAVGRPQDDDVTLVVFRLKADLVMHGSPRAVGCRRLQVTSNHHHFVATKAQVYSSHLTPCR